MKKYTLLSILCCAFFWLSAQTPQVDTTLEVVPLDETVIAVTRSSMAKRAVAQQVRVLRLSEIEAANAQSSADLLLNTGQVFVQKSQQGGGSPVLRGFEASRVLIVVDGVRMNNAIYRAGHLQNIITMDNAALDRAELLFGPASTVYGSDALGGAICFYTKNPRFATGDEKVKLRGNAFFRYGSINQEKTTHADFNIGGKKIASLSSFTFSDFGDLRMGENSGLEGVFGKRDYYVDRINGQDTLLRNEDPYVQKFSGFKQYDFLEKIVFYPNSNSQHSLNLQYSTSSNIPRYDRLTDRSGNGLSNAEWYYGPQERLMAAYSFSLKSLGTFDAFKLTASYQDIEESRHNRGFGSSGRNDRIEQISVYGLLAEVLKLWDNQSLRIGLDGQYNDVKSTASRFNVNTGEVTSQSTRYPDGGSDMLNLAVYGTHFWKSNANSRWSFSEGFRAGFSSLNASFVSREFFPLPFDEVSQNVPTFSGNAGAVWAGPDDWQIAINASTGFRVPNVDDLTKVFDSQAGSVIVPNPDIKPEKTLNLDLNFTYNISGKVHWENVFWITGFRDAIVTDVFQFNGQDSIEYEGVLSRVLANQNKRNARLWGMSSSVHADLYDNLALYASIAYTKGQILNDPGADTPLDHIPPVYGKFGFRWHTTRASVESFVLFNGKKRLEDYNLEGEDNLRYAPVNGMPGWFTANIRGSYSFFKNLKLQAGIDNIFDTNYRLFASGINAPGRNFWVTARIGF
ncbi:MAG: TonB-dependent receptor [Lewinellaceae bacterium]|nr:TonB-dependent receptor [Lewinellaceae bacterium]